MRDYKANTFQMDSSIFRFGLTPIQFVVYSYLIYCAGNRCACSIKLQTIASVCECSRSSVKRALNVCVTVSSSTSKAELKNCVAKVIGKPATATIVWIAVSGKHRSALTGSRSPAGPRRLGTATRISASLSRRLSAFFESTSRPRPKSGKVCRSDTWPRRVSELRKTSRG